MRITIGILCLVIFGQGLEAQEITQDNFPEKGDAFTKYAADTAGVDEKNSGNSIDWDYTDQLEMLSSFEVTYKAPQNTPGGTNFPNADLAAQEMTMGQEVYSFYHLTNNKAEIIGQYVITERQGQEIEIALDFKDSAKIREFPMQYNDSFYDQYSIQDTADIGFPFDLIINSNGSNAVKFDGVGSIQTSSDTFNDVKRLKTVTKDTTVQSLGGQELVNQKTETLQYEFFNANDKTPLLQISYSTVRADGETESSKSVIMNEEMKQATSNSSGINNDQGITGSIITFPNPVKDQLNLVLSVNHNTPLSARIVNANGKEMLQRDYGAVQKGNLHKTFNAGNWDRGIYFLEVQTKDGIQSRKFLVK